MNKYFLITAIIVLIAVMIYLTIYLKIGDRPRIEFTNKTEFKLPEIKRNIDTTYFTNNELLSKLGDGAIISRTITGISLGRHYGVVYKGKIAHFNNFGYHYDDISTFINGQTITIELYGLSGDVLKSFENRFDSISQKYKKIDYDVMQNNCIHFVHELITGKKLSTSYNMKSYIDTIQKNIFKNLNETDFNNIKKIFYENTKNN